MGWFQRLIDKIVQSVIDPIVEWFKNLGRSIARIFESIGDFFVDLIMKPIRGIERMIADINEIVCFIKKLPNRLANIQSGVNNIFTGIIDQFEALGTAFELGYTDTKNLFVYTGEFLNTYIQCMVKMISNFYKCAVFYILDVIGKVMMLPFRICMWAVYNFFNINLYPLEQSIWDGIEMVDSMIFSVIGVHIAHYPKSVRDDCYTCIRLKREAVRERAEELNTTFTETIPDLFYYGKGGCKIRRGKAQLDEVGRLPTARHPSEIRVQ